MSESSRQEVPFEDADALDSALKQQDYFGNEDLVLTLLLAMRLGKPLLLEGAPGVGKTSVASALASALSTALIRLQCYEGLDAAASLYEWNHAKQILRIRMAEAAGDAGAESLEESIFSEDYLLERPLLQALRHEGESPAVLLIDEVDRADEEFEAFLLEVLSEFQITIPELGAIRAARRPIVILTSNNSRELSDALRRRCLYLWIDLPSAAQEREIVERSVPGIEESLTRALVEVVGKIRALDLDKPPGIAESVDWARALVALGAESLSPELIRQTQSALIKSHRDAQLVAHERDAWFPSSRTGEMR